MQDQALSVVIEDKRVKQAVVHDDRRSYPRISRSLVTTVTELGVDQSHRCTVKDISESGLYLRVPPDYDLCVGRRCEVAITDENNVENPSSLIGESLYATVVRTERIELETETVVGVGLRFDQPLYF